MHREALLVLVLLTPSGMALEQVHVSFLGDAYGVTFVDENRANLTWPGGTSDVSSAGRYQRAKVPLDAGTYAIGNASFVLPAPPSPMNHTRVAYLADMGTGDAAREVWAAIAASDPDLVLIGGDLAYAHGDPQKWDAWFRLVEPLSTRIPIMPAYGNHESYCDAPDGAYAICGPEGNGWHEAFWLPNAPALHYAFEWGAIRIVVLDTEAFERGEETGEQLTTLNATLSQDDPGWSAVMFHRPLRSTMARNGSESVPTRAAIEPILDLHAPDIVLTAHVHAYERSHPLRAGAVAENGTYYVTSGGGGRDLYVTWGPEEPWLAKRASLHHFVLIDADATTLRVRALLANGTELDSFSLRRDPPAPPTPTPATTPVQPTPSPTPTSTPTATSPPIEPPGHSAEVTPPAQALVVALAVALVALLRASRRPPARRAP